MNGPGSSRILHARTLERDTMSHEVGDSGHSGVMRFSTTQVREEALEARLRISYATAPTPSQHEKSSRQ